MFQALNYVEGKAPEWTRQEAALFSQSLLETGYCPPRAADPGERPRRFGGVDVAPGGLLAFHRAAVRRADRLPRACVQRVRADPDHSHPSLRFELQPIVMPIEFEYRSASLTLWDRLRTTRSFLRFAPPEGGKDVPVSGDVVDDEQEFGRLAAAGAGDQ